MSYLATGKSTFIKILEEASETEDWEITPEPVSQWTQIDGEQVKTARMLRFITYQWRHIRWC